MYVCGELDLALACVFLCLFVLRSCVFCWLYGIVVLFVLKTQKRLGVVVEQVDCCVGDVAQMVERSLSMREVQGSIPCFSSAIMLP